MKKNLELEKQILAKLMIDADLLLESELSENDFVNPTHKKLFQAIKEVGSNLALIQSKFVEEEQDYILEIAAMLMTSGRKENYAELKRLTEVRRLETILKGLQMAIDDDQSLDLIYEKIAQFDKQEIQVADMKEVLVEIVAELTGTVTAIYHPTGYTKLDKYLRGFTPGQLNIIAARPSIGKTMVAMNFLLKQTEADKKIALFSLEMTNKEISQRILARNSGMPVDQMNKPATPEQLERVNTAMIKLEAQLKNLTLIDSVYTLPQITRMIKYLHKKSGLDLVYIDYLQIFDIKGDNRNLEIGKITRTLKKLAKDLQISIILLSQLNRSLETRADQDPKLSDLRDSGSIEQDADIVLMLGRDLEYYPETMKVFIRKNRNGSLGEVELVCKPASMQIGN
ncbi:hypothetical protein D8B45_07340 [Candidatus Gracilibacteria bacterium]|nr:MAG: hypothetical protein D8B45_07340 [Candidatus Gracilibacteria bacterium]